MRQTFKKLLQTRSTYRNNTKEMFVKRVMTHTRCRYEYRPIFRFLRFYVFFTTVSTSKKMFSFGARAEKGTARHIDASGVVGT